MPRRFIAGDTTRVPVLDNYGHKVRVLTVGTGGSRVVLDAEVDTGDNRRDRSDADQAVAMIRHLLDEHGDSLDGLRCFAHDMALGSTGIDEVMSMGVLPIVKVRGREVSEPWLNSLGIHRFTAADGTTRGLEVDAVNGAPVVTLPDSSGVDTAIRLRRRCIRWEDQNQRHRVAYGQYEIPIPRMCPTT